MSTAAASDGLLSIGEVLHLLRSDFPDVSISKIRYLESEDLVQPQRTPSGYRKFTRADAERLRYVLRMQRDHYLPLKVIREHLDAIDRGLQPAPLSATDTAPRALVTTDAYPSPEDLAAESQELRLSRKELLEESGITNEVLRELESFGLVAQAPGTSYYDATALQVARIAAEMAQFGYGPRHLRPFRLAADRELSLVEQVVKPMARGRHEDSAVKAEEAARAIATLAIQLHVALVKAGLPGTLGR
ncbi:MAG: MerR family transcriptional regulator [Candidatus Nanopelagicales bacterium]|nr:MerR family transcriptional regulator [Candidatus Nanopelagicales bacterium]